MVEESKLEARNFRFEDPETRLKALEVSQVAEAKGSSASELVELLVRYPDNTFRTMHFDLVFRAVHLEPDINAKQIPLEFLIPKIRTEEMPEFDEIALESLSNISRLPSSESNALLNALKGAGYKGLAYHQSDLIKRIMSDKSRCYLLVSPTASGKSLIFYLPIIMSAVEGIRNKPSTKAFVLYPRKSLASDQLLKFLLILHYLNEGLARLGLRKVTIGIDDGDTPRSASTPSVRNGEFFRGVRCVKPSNGSSCNGLLQYSVKASRATIICQKCGNEYDEIKPTKEDIWNASPDIVITNIYTENRRLMTLASQKLFGEDLQWIVLDEAHVYREELGGNAYWLLRRLLARLGSKSASHPTLVISSATIPKPVDFAMKLTGLGEKDIYYEDFKDIVGRARKKKTKLNLNLLIAPHPERSAESLAEELALLVGVWARNKQKKSILFVDNTSEVERLYNLIVSTIIRERQEQNVHLTGFTRGRQSAAALKRANDVTDPFSWRSVTGNSSSADSESLAQGYGFHYADLGMRERSEVENAFKNPASGLNLLISTSTLELGIDIGDVAAVIQYKVPISSENYLQRVGRAGRGEKTLRVSLGILVLTNSPSQIRYIVKDDYLWLLDPLKKDPNFEIPIASANEEIMRQHLVYSLLDVLASKGFTTFMDYRDEIRTKWSTTDVRNVLETVRSLVERAQSSSVDFNSYLARIAPEGEFKASFKKTIDRLNRVIAENLNLLDQGVDAGAVKEGLAKLNESESSLGTISSQLETMVSKSEETSRKHPSNEFRDFSAKATQLKLDLINVLKSLESLKAV